MSTESTVTDNPATNAGDVEDMMMPEITSGREEGKMVEPGSKGVRVVVVPTKTEDGGEGSATTNSERTTTRDAFLRYSDDNVRMRGMLGLAEVEGRRVGDAEENEDIRGRGADHGDHEDFREEGAGNINDGRGADGPPGGRKTRLSVELHPSMLYLRQLNEEE